MKKLKASLVGLFMCLFCGSAWADSTYQLFGPAQGAGVYTGAFGTSCCAEWVSPTAFTSSTKTFLFDDLNKKPFRWVRGLVIWVPGGPWNCIQFFYRYMDWADGGVDHPMGFFCGINLVPRPTDNQFEPWLNLVPQGLDLTVEFNKLVAEHRNIFVGYKTWDNGTRFHIWEVRLEVFE